ncbi:MAG: hypothetical protein HC896_14945 [Bacteroidales bacterium]|nr:hypothetical protein [Bacteroidales bacterium]
MQIEALPANVYETFGMTETASHIALRKVSATRGPFYTLPGVRVDQSDENCLVIHAPHISTEPIITNDIVELVNKESFYWIGRKDNQINSGGLKIHPERIEKLIRTFVQQPFFVTSLPDHLLGEKMVLLIENGGTVNIANVQLNLQNELDRHTLPKSIFVLNQFMRTGNGKIIRHATRNMMMTGEIEIVEQS